MSVKRGAVIPDGLVTDKYFVSGTIGNVVFCKNGVIKIKKKVTNVKK